MKLMKVLIVFSLLMFGLNFVNSADFTPQGNINLRDYYNITGAPYINATLYYGNGSQLTEIIASTSNYSSFANSSTYWDDYNTASDLNDLITIQGENISGGTIDFERLPTLTNMLTLDWSNITNKFITAVDNLYIYMSGTTATLNETKLNLSIRAIDTVTNTSMKNYVDSANSSQTSWTDSFFVRFTELVGQIGNWSSDKSNYYTHTTINTFNLSHWTDDLGNRGYTDLVNFSNSPGYITNYTDTNETIRFDTLVGTDCGVGDYSYGFDSNGLIQCREDIDTDTTYTAGSNLTLTGTILSLDTTGVTTWLDTVYAGISTIFDGTWSSLTGKPTLLSNFTDDLGDRGYTSNLNFTNDAGYYNLSNFDIDDYLLLEGGIITGNITADDFIIGNMTLNGETYSSIYDWASVIQTSGYFEGGDFTNNGDGTLNVSSGSGLIRDTDSELAPIMFFDWEENISVPLIDNSTNYIYVTYNSGTPIVSSTLSKSTINGRDTISLGKVYRESTTLHMIKAGMIISEPVKNTLGYLTNVFGEVKRASGSEISETGTLNLASTAGVAYAGLTRLSIPSQDTSGADTFEYYYYDGVGWIETSSSIINNSYYNNPSSGLSELTANRYGVHWVYIDGDADGKILVVYGQDDYKLADAQAAQPPASLPNHISEFALLAAKVIIKKGESSFTELGSAYDISFTSALVGDHNELSGLQGGTGNEYYHLTSNEYSVLQSSNYDNESWNQSLADTLYYGIDNPSNYYNSSDFSISDYYTKANIESLGYYNSSDFSISDYYTSTQTDTEIGNANTSMKNYADATFLTNELDPLWSGNSTLIVYTADTNNWDKNSADDFDGAYSSLSGNPTSLSDFADDIGVSSDWDAIGDVPTATPSNGDTTHLSTADQIYDYINGLSHLVAGDLVGLIGNWTADKVNYYTSTQTDTEIGNANTSMKNYVDSNPGGYSTTTGTVTSIATTSPLSGGTITSTGTLSLIACSDTEIYKYNNTAGAWECESDESGTANFTNVAFTNISETFDEDLTIAKNLIVQGNNISLGSSEVDQSIWFYEDGDLNERMYWDNGGDQFQLTDGIRVQGTLNVVGGNLIAAGGINIIGGGDIYTTGTGDDLWLGTTVQNSALFKAYANGSLIVKNLEVTDGINVNNIPTATPSNGDTTHLSTADQIYDWIIGLGYSSFGASIDDTEMTAEDFGEFTCTGNEDGCTLDTGSFDDEYIELGDSFGGEVSGTYGAITIGNDVLDDQYYDSEADLTGLLNDNYEVQLNNEAGLYAVLSDVTQFYEAGDKVGDADTLDTHDTSYFQTALTNEASLYSALSDVSDFLQSLIDDTTPQLGGYLDTNGQNIGATDDEIENIYIGDNTRIYFGDGQDASMYYNGTVLIIG